MSVLLSRTAAICAALMVSFVLSACGRVESTVVEEDVEEEEVLVRSDTEAERRTPAPPEVNHAGPSDPELGRSTPGPSGGSGADRPQRPPE